ncbi:MAG: hypothetical protein E5W02_28020, partial [Mesorhizobium sp.]
MTWSLALSPGFSPSAGFLGEVPSDMDFLSVDGRLGAGLEQIAISQACFEKTRGVVQHEAEGGR